MSFAKIFKIKESVKEIKQLQKSSTNMIAKRLHALLLFKEHEHTGISKRVVAEAIGVNHNSIQAWRSLYINGGIKALMSHGKIGFKPSVITEQEEKALSAHLHKADNGIVGFVELQAWFQHKFDKEINYKTLHGFVVRKYKAKIKVARKSHIKKDKDSVADFKKNSAKLANSFEK